MAVRQWTEPQQNAINAGGGNIIVSAAAGSGKTAVLVERVVRLITDKTAPVDIDKLLVVTFTIPATAEMKARISARLEQMLADDPSNHRIMRQLSLLPSAKICTIDAFCMNLVRENFYELNISQDFTVLENSEANVISDNALNAVLDEFYELNDSDFLRLVESLSVPKDESGLISAVKNVYDYISAQPAPLIWLKNAVETYRPGQKFQDSAWYPIAEEYVTDKLNYALLLSDKCMSFIDAKDDCAGYYSEFLGIENNQCKLLIQALEKDWNELADVLSTVSFKRFYTSKKDFDAPEYAGEIVARRNLYKSIIQSLANEITIRPKDLMKITALYIPCFPCSCALLKNILWNMQSSKRKEMHTLFRISCTLPSACLWILMKTGISSNLLRQRNYRHSITRYLWTNIRIRTARRILYSACCPAVQTGLWSAM